MVPHKSRSWSTLALLSNIWLRIENQNDKKTLQLILNRLIKEQRIKTGCKMPLQRDDISKYTSKIHGHVI